MRIGALKQEFRVGDLRAESAAATKAKHRGIAGFVVDGLIRDLPALLPLDFPVFARGTTSIGPLHRGPGEINYSISLGGIVVNPGDLVVADGAGIVVIPRDIAPELLLRLKSHEESNAAYLEAVQRGEFSNQWVDRILDQHGCPVIPGQGFEPAPASPTPLVTLLAAGGDGVFAGTTNAIP